MGDVLKNTSELLGFYERAGVTAKLEFKRGHRPIIVVDFPVAGKASVLLDGFNSLFVAALAFLNEYEKYREDDSVAFVPNREVLDAFRKAVNG